MTTRPYKLFGEHERTSACAAVEERARAWAAAWLPQESRFRIECAPAREQKERFHGVNVSHWTRTTAAAGQWLAMRASEKTIHDIATAICGNTDASTAASYTGYAPLAVEVARTALRQLAAALLGTPSTGSSGLQVGEAAVPAAVWAAGSAALALRLGLGQAVIDFVSSPEWTLRLLTYALPRSSPAILCERRKGIAGQRVELRVVAGWVDLDLRTLQSLEVGNVIALDTRIDQAMTVVIASDGQPAVCGGRLGNADGGKAVVLSALRS